ncbi:MAG: hypothetical protein J6S24_05685, partial [Lentisphaeria bacterium]|nr:hypothetical protein [Lentisphaeria bacterium]
PGGAKRDIIYHLILLCQAEFYFLFVFYSARLVPSPSVGGEQGHNIAPHRNLSNAFQNFFYFSGHFSAKHLFSTNKKPHTQAKGFSKRSSDISAIFSILYINMTYSWGRKKNLGFLQSQT